MPIDSPLGKPFCLLFPELHRKDCRVFALSDAGDTDFQKVSSHNHNVKCEDCEKLKSVLEEVKGAISEYTMQLGKFQAEDYLYEAKKCFR